MKRYLYAAVVCCALVLITDTSVAQNRYDVLRYVTTQPGIDAVTTAYGGASTALATGLGAASDNPAVLGLVKSSTFNFGFNTRRIEEQANYLNTSLQLNQGTTSISDIGFIYSIPTVRGSFVMGGGYNRISEFVRGHQLYAYNEESTITDSYSSPNSQYYDLAFRKAYFDLEDGDFSILRFAPYAGINQDSEQTEVGQMGELNFFSAWEAAPNLYLGASVAVPFGFYRYSRYWLEEDTKGDYFGEFFVEYDNGDRYFDDFRDLYTLDEINASIVGLYGRIGIVYKVQPWFNVGASYRTPTTMTVREDYFSNLEMNFDNGDFVGPEQLEGQITYKVKNPGRLNIGAAIDDFNGLSISGSAEFVNYSTSEIRFKDPSSSDISYQREENIAISREFQDVWNVKFGIGYRMGSIEPILGYSKYPGVSRDFSDDLETYSAGLKILASEDFYVNLAASYTAFSDTQTMYQGLGGAQNLTSDVKRFQLVGGLVFKF